ncbi:MAG: VWA domain-containing protein, partial [Rhodospirillaceae bacterium]|nr:VWA domain-containing protein [Rhodospirillaceae bacterium]
PEHLVAFISEICQRNHVAGHRADIVMERAARAHAAWEGRSDVVADDILKVAPMVLLHRMRAGTPDIPPPPPPPPPPKDDDDQADENQAPNPDQPDDQQDDAPPPPEGDDPGGEGPEEDASNQDDGPDDAPPPPPQDPSDVDTDDGQDVPDDVQEVGTSYSVRRLERQSVDQTLRTGSGRRSRSRSASKQGRYVKSTSRQGRNDLALDATIRAAAPYQLTRRETALQALAVHIADSDIREKVRERRVGNFLLFVVDGSGSMGAQRRMVETKAAIMSLLLDAYQKRDKVAMVLFRGREAEVVLPPTNSVDRAAKLLADLPIGGRTPLSAGLSEAAGVLRQVLRKEPSIMPLVIVMTDGRANAGLGTAAPHEEAMHAAAGLRERYASAQFIVVDTEPKGVVRLGLASKLASALGAAYFKTEDLRAEDLVSIAKEHQAW